MPGVDTDQQAGIHARSRGRGAIHGRQQHQRARRRAAYTGGTGHRRDDGEIREAYTDELCREMIDSGLNSVTVTLCDPKSYEAQAYEWAINGVLEYDRLINKESEFWLKAVSVADIDSAVRQGKIALFSITGNSNTR